MASVNVAKDMVANHTREEVEQYVLRALSNLRYDLEGTTSDSMAVGVAYVEVQLLKDIMQALVDKYIGKSEGVVL